MMNIFAFIGNNSRTVRLSYLFAQPLLIVELDQNTKAQMEQLISQELKHKYKSILQLIITTCIAFALVNAIREHRITAFALAFAVSFCSVFLVFLIYTIHLTVLKRGPRFLVFAESGICILGKTHSWDASGDKLEHIVYADNTDNQTMNHRNLRLTFSYSLAKPAGKRSQSATVIIPNSYTEEVSSLIRHYQKQLPRGNTN